MKTKSTSLLVGLLFAMTFVMVVSSCKCDCPDSVPDQYLTEELHSGKYISGKIIVHPDINQLGIFNHQDGHDVNAISFITDSESYIDKSQINSSTLDGKWWSKVKRINNIPVSYDLTNSKPSSSEIYIGAIYNNLDLHNFLDHDTKNKNQIHIRGHVQTLSPKADSNNLYPVTIGYSVGSHTDSLFVNKANHDILSTIGESEFFYEILERPNGSKELINISQCHTHHNTQDTCVVW